MEKRMASAPAEGGQGAPNATSDTDEKFYRMGYEAASHAKYRCNEYDQILSEMQADLQEVQSRYPHVDLETAFRKGFEKGLAQSQELCNGTDQEDGEHKKATGPA